MDRSPVLPPQFRALLRRFGKFIHARIFFRTTEDRWVEFGDLDVEREIWELWAAPHQAHLLVEEDRLPMGPVGDREVPYGQTGS